MIVGFYFIWSKFHVHMAIVDVFNVIIMCVLSEICIFRLTLNLHLRPIYTTLQAPRFNLLSRFK